MTMTGAALLLAGARALAQSASDQGSTEAKVVRIYATADGGSRVEELTISPDAKPIDITRMTASVYRGSGARAPDWHTAPRKQFAINMTGELEVELTDGTRRKIGHIADDLAPSGLAETAGVNTAIRCAARFSAEAECAAGGATSNFGREPRREPWRGLPRRLRGRS
jgi:hypothetical protein